VFSGTENILRHSKYNLPFAGANEIPPKRDWAIALPALMFAKPALSIGMYLLFRIAIIVF